MNSLSQITKERDECRTVQDWNPTATRSGWWHELSELIDAIEAFQANPESIETAEEFARCSRAADEERFRLAEKVARRMVDTCEIAEAAAWAQADDDIYEAVKNAGPVAEAVGILRAAGVTIAQGSNSTRKDGFVITPEEAYAFASCRSFDSEDSSYVTVDLLTGKVERW